MWTHCSVALFLLAFIGYHHAVAPRRRRCKSIFQLLLHIIVGTRIDYLLSGCSGISQLSAHCTNLRMDRSYLRRTRSHSLYAPRQWPSSIARHVSHGKRHSHSNVVSTSFDFNRSSSDWLTNNFPYPSLSSAGCGTL